MTQKANSENYMRNKRKLLKNRNLKLEATGICSITLDLGIVRS